MRRYIVTEVMTGVGWLGSIPVTIFLSCHCDAIRYFMCIKVKEVIKKTLQIQQSWPL